MTVHDVLFRNQIVDWLLRKTNSSSVRRIATLSAAIASDIGVSRSDNQDKAILARGFDNQGNPYVVGFVADGIGGLSDGALCAAFSISTLMTYLISRIQTQSFISIEVIKTALIETNKVVFDQFKGNGGATISGFILLGCSDSFWFCVGDSRVYAMSSGTLNQLSVDDTIAGQLGRQNTSDISAHHLIQFIGFDGELEPHVEIFDKSKVSSILLTTDGIHFISKLPNIMETILQYAEDVGVGIKRLVDLSKWCGGNDNATAIAISLTGSNGYGVGNNSNVLDVWDAFGELKIIKTTPASHQPSPSSNSLSIVEEKPKKPRKPRAKKSDSLAKEKPQKKPIIRKEQLEVEFTQPNVPEESLDARK